MSGNRDKDRRIRIALQKSGRLSDESFSLLEKCGIKIRRDNGKLFCHSENFPIDALLIRDDDIPNMLLDDVCDLGIVGTNVLKEKSLKLNNNSIGSIEPILNLNFGFCHLAIAVPDTFCYESAVNLNGKRIATSYPFLLEEFLAAKKVAAKTVILTGAVEIAPRLNIADAICDLVSTGSTLEANGLREVETIFNSQATLVKSGKKLADEKQKIFDSLRSRIESAHRANETKYIMLHCSKSKIDEIVELIPGAENPTIMPLTGNQDAVAIHAVCKESVFWETLELLKNAGASAILVLPIEKMMA